MLLLPKPNHTTATNSSPLCQCPALSMSTIHPNHFHTTSVQYRHIMLYSYEKTLTMNINYLGFSQKVFIYNISII